MHILGNILRDLNVFSCIIKQLTIKTHFLKFKLKFHYVAIFFSYV